MRDLDKVFSDFFSDMDRFSIGLRPQFDQIKQVAHNHTINGIYPPHDLVEVDTNKYQLSLAVAGYTENDLEIQQDDRTLIVRGEKVATTEAKILHKGISNRSFVKKFFLNEHVNVVSSELSNGMLTINLVRDIPEELKPKLIPITVSTPALTDQSVDSKNTQ